jgi:alpha-methylacyl-CoA racemase
MIASGPLAGLKVLEFAGIGPGPFVGMMLSDGTFATTAQG